MRRLCTGLPPQFESFLLVVLAIQMVVRGIDYFSGDMAGTSVALEYAQRSLPLVGWGVMFWMGGAIILVALVMRIQMLMFAGLAIGTAGYLALTVAMGMAVASDSLDGIRTPADALGNAALCFGLAVWGVVRVRMAEMRCKQLEED